MPELSDHLLHFVISEQVDWVSGRIELLIQERPKLLNYESDLYVRIARKVVNILVFTSDDLEIKCPVSEHDDLVSQGSDPDCSSVLGFEIVHCLLSEMCSHEEVAICNQEIRKVLFHIALQGFPILLGDCRPFSICRFTQHLAIEDLEGAWTSYDLLLLLLCRCCCYCIFLHNLFLYIL